METLHEASRVALARIELRPGLLLGGEPRLVTDGRLGLEMQMGG